jgi:hypothetical protein
MNRRRRELPPPLWGRAGVGGSHENSAFRELRPSRTHPPPLPSPTRGPTRGEGTAGRRSHQRFCCALSQRPWASSPFFVGRGRPLLRAKCSPQQRACGTPAVPGAAPQATSTNPAPESLPAAPLARGIETTNRAPLPGCDVASISQPCLSAMVRQIANPIPDPGYSALA